MKTTQTHVSTKPGPRPITPLEMSEADCGGVFDGSQVTSDAGSGL